MFIVLIIIFVLLNWVIVVNLCGLNIIVIFVNLIVWESKVKVDFSGMVFFVLVLGMFGFVKFFISLVFIGLVIMLKIWGIFLRFKF